MPDDDRPKNGKVFLMPRRAANAGQTPVQIGSAEISGALAGLQSARIKIAGGAEMFAPEHMNAYEQLQEARAQIVKIESNIRAIVAQFATPAADSQNHVAPVMEPAKVQAK